ncbi:tRNA (adenosine(37)-N6)-threonylcarbamoyltransferase complex ATPase subunit type 1 TsaE [Roseateles koreensis]|uniref:tRNA threonylcarbamoyladenosine biosynthesis protein TsaE n=1 Tax=Roseateles koreensis TaxID=2987526 RepID=A0ABT5KQW4_9BURK|nr:tRNA (adenosine(37)-N6)-threonylcarbamoyltransferase complex ATPase subunit type 1 TsaE [Roseateles koreensis]MDC8785284.1 tRNA (adenosine(37)-N6)-threonylcarbamoyltransferase complex ATPase subunit type 1 TsaE [Roseateles koreensis]
MRILETRLQHWPDEAATQAFCEQWARVLVQHPSLMNASIELHGTLGAGKTSLVRHLLRALGVQGRIKSPSYAVMESYALDANHGAALVSHFDFYRFDDPREWEDAGFRDVFAAPGLKLSEWPEKAAGMLPLPDLQICIEVADDDSRQVKLHAGTAPGVELLNRLIGGLA